LFGDKCRGDENFQRQRTNTSPPLGGHDRRRACGENGGTGDRAEAFSMGASVGTDVALRLTGEPLVGRSVGWCASPWSFYRGQLLSLPSPIINV